jgi:hypothetical protein
MNYESSVLLAQSALEEISEPNRTRARNLVGDCRSDVSIGLVELLADADAAGRFQEAMETMANVRQSNVAYWTRWKMGQNGDVLKPRRLMANEGSRDGVAESG